MDISDKRLQIATVFSGIGAPEQALNQLGIPHDIVFACDNGERYLKKSYEDIQKATKGFSVEEREKYVNKLYEDTGKENLVKKSYFANYNITEERWHEDIRFVDGTRYHGQVDMLVGGSPCQSFSTYGKKRGLEDVRGTLFYDYARLISEIQPKVFVYENVKGLLTHEQGNTWKVMLEVWESLDYNIFWQVLDAKDYNLPQSRRRLFVVGFAKRLAVKSFAFPEKIKLERKSTEFLNKEIPIEYYLPEKGYKWVTDVSRNKNKARINRDIIGCQTAIQQFNWSGDFRLESPAPTHYESPDVYVGHNTEGEDFVARKLMPEECLRLMGFEEFKIVVEDKVAYRQTGNSIAVPVLKSLFQTLISLI